MRVVKEYREGLIPQSDAAYRATLSAYSTNREQFIHVLSYFTDVLALKLEYRKPSLITKPLWLTSKL